VVRELLASPLGFGQLFRCLTCSHVHPNLATKWLFCGDRRETGMRDDDIVKAARDDDIVKAAE
jgi:hypothetical protein